MNEIICKAIRGSLLLGFTYKGDKRWVEPHTYGRKPNGVEALSAWQRAGGSGEGFRLFFSDEISGLEVGAPFGLPRPDYRRGDSRFEQIFAEL